MSHTGTPAERRHIRERFMAKARAAGIRFGDIDEEGRVPFHYGPSSDDSRRGTVALDNLVNRVLLAETEEDREEIQQRWIRMLQATATREEDAPIPADRIYPRVLHDHTCKGQTEFPLDSEPIMLQWGPLMLTIVHDTGDAFVMLARGMQERHFPGWTDQQLLERAKQNLLARANGFEWIRYRGVSIGLPGCPEDASNNAALATVVREIVGEADWPPTGVIFAVPVRHEMVLTPLVRNLQGLMFLREMLSERFDPRPDRLNTGFYWTDGRSDPEVVRIDVIEGQAVGTDLTLVPVGLGPRAMQVLQVLMENQQN